MSINRRKFIKQSALALAGASILRSNLVAATGAPQKVVIIGAGMAGDAAGNLYFQDYFRVRKLSPDGTLTTVAGNGTRGYSGDGGAAVNAQLSSAVDGFAVGRHLGPGPRHKVRLDVVCAVSG